MEQMDRWEHAKDWIGGLVSLGVERNPKDQGGSEGASGSSCTF